MKKILGATLVISLMLVMPAISSAAVIGSLTVNPTNATLGQSVTFSGTCGTIGANGNVGLGITNGGTAQVFGSVSSNLNGDFTGTFTLPANFPTGASTVTATCPNGDMVTGIFSGNTAISSGLTVTGTPFLGQTVSVSGSCGSSVGNGMNVSFILTRGSSTVSLGSTTTSADGTFTSNVTIPSTFNGGPASIVASCPNGNVTQDIGVLDSTASLALGSNVLNVGGSINISGVCGSTGGQLVNVDLVSASVATRIANLTTNADGTFNTVVTIPNSIVTGSGTIQTTCQGGTVSTAAVTINPSNSIPSDLGGTSETGTVAGVSTTPVGGVAAGGPSNPVAAMTLLLVVGIAGFIVTRYNLSHDGFSS